MCKLICYFCINLKHEISVKFYDSNVFICISVEMKDGNKPTEGEPIGRAIRGQGTRGRGGWRGARGNIFYSSTHSLIYWLFTQSLTHSPTPHLLLFIRLLTHPLTHAGPLLFHIVRLSLSSVVAETKRLFKEMVQGH